MEGDMAAPTDVNNDNKFEILNTSSQPNVSITCSSNKRSNPDNPDTLPATQKQTLRQIRRRNFVILAPTRRPLYQEKILQTKFLRLLQVLMSLIK